MTQSDHRKGKLVALMCKNVSSKEWGVNVWYDVNKIGLDEAIKRAQQRIEDHRAVYKSLEWKIEIRSEGTNA